MVLMILLAQYDFSIANEGIGDYFLTLKPDGAKLISWIEVTHVNEGRCRCCCPGESVNKMGYHLASLILDIQ